MASTKIDKTKLYQNVTNINKALVSLSKEIKSLNSNLNLMMKGDSDGPYWNGKAADKFYTKAVANLKNDIEDYNSAFQRLQNIADKYNNLINNDDASSGGSYSDWNIANGADVFSFDSGESF